MSIFEGVLVLVVFYAVYISVIQSRRNIKNNDGIKNNNNNKPIENRSSREPMKEITKDMLIDNHLDIVDTDEFNRFVTMKQCDVIRLHSQIDDVVTTKVLPMVNDLIRRINTASYIVEPMIRYDGLNSDSISREWIERQLSAVNEYKISFYEVCLYYRKDKLIRTSIVFWVYDKGINRCPRSVYLLGTDGVFTNKDSAVDYIKEIVSTSINDKIDIKYKNKMNDAISSISERI